MADKVCNNCKESKCDGCGRELVLTNSKGWSYSIGRYVYNGCNICVECWENGFRGKEDNDEGTGNRDDQKV